MNKFLYELASSDESWSKLIFEYYNNSCGWSGCTNRFGLSAHHVIPRRFMTLRFLLMNGILLCEKHHSKVESIKGTKSYDDIMYLLLGKERYETLLLFKKDYLTKLNESSKTISEVSKVEF